METDAAAYPALDEVRRKVDPAFQEALQTSSLSEADLLLRYVPIAMAPELLDRYPARSKARLKQRILDCAPQLRHEPFVSGTFAEQVRAYVEGIRTAAALLPKFGYSAAQIQQFEELLDRVIERYSG